MFFDLLGRRGIDCAKCWYDNDVGNCRVCSGVAVPLCYQVGARDDVVDVQSRFLGEEIGDGFRRVGGVVEEYEGDVVRLSAETHVSKWRRSLFREVVGNLRFAMQHLHQSHSSPPPDQSCCTASDRSVPAHACLR